MRSSAVGDLAAGDGRDGGEVHVLASQVVECVTEMKSGCASTARCAGTVVGHTFDLGLGQGAQQPPPGAVAVRAPRHDLGQQVVVVLADDVARLVAGVGAHPGTGRPGAQARDRPGRGDEPCRPPGPRR